MRKLSKRRRRQLSPLRRWQVSISLSFLVSLFSVVRAQNGLFSDVFSPDSIMGASAAGRGAPTSTPPGFSDQSAYVGLSAAGALVAVGDFDRDRFVDLVVLNSQTLRDLSILFWDHDAFAFRHRGHGVRLSELDEQDKKFGIKPMGKVVGVHVADFGNDGTLDVLLHDGMQGRLFFGDGDGNFNASSPVIIPELPLESAVVDANADLIPDVFVAFRNGTRGFWVFEREKATKEEGDDEPVSQEGKMVFKPWVGGANRASDGADCVVLDPVSISFVDMDGDCLPDLVIPTSCGIEVWSNPATSDRSFWDLAVSRTSAESDLKLIGLEVFNNAHGDQSMVFADFNSDGAIDIGVPNSNRRDLLIHLNIQKKRTADALCARDSEWTLARRIGLSSGLNLGVRKIGRLFGSIGVPPSLHIGDYDLDGMPDIMVIDSSSKRPVLFRNEGKWDNKHNSQSHFARMNPNDEAGLSSGNSGAVTAMFFDTDESGRQDILVVRGSNETRLMWNQLQQQSDSLFFKGTMLSGRPYRSVPRPFSPVPGNTFKLSYIERGSRSHVTRTCSQCSQGGLWQLRPCNCQFGLMQIANYIETLWAGGGAGTRAWTNLMPNSMAVIWAETAERRGDTSLWWMEYFTQRRGSQMLRISALLIASLAVLAVAILVLQQRERKQDREYDEQERVQLFNFA